MKNNKTLSKLNSYIAGNRKYLILVIISALLANIFMLVAPYISGRAIDFIKGENNVDFPMVAKFIGILFAVYVLNALFQNCRLNFLTVIHTAILSAVLQTT